MVARSVRAVTALVLVVAVVVAVAAGCGDDGPGEDAAPGGERDGRTLFLEGTTPSCGNCHTLSAAGTSSRVGPNLDDSVAPDWFIAQTIRDGFGIMPAFEDQLTDDEIDTLAAYVEASSSH